MTLLSGDKNHSVYRQQLLKARPPLVPYLGIISIQLRATGTPALMLIHPLLAALFSKDLFGVEESSPTITSEGLVNFHKMRIITRLVNDFAAYQVSLMPQQRTACSKNLIGGIRQIAYPIPIEPTLRSLLKGVQPLSPDEQYDLSYRLEPRKNA